VIDLCRTHFPEVSAGAFDDPRTRVVIADGTKFVAETDERFDVIMIDSTDPIGPGAVLFTREFYADCRKALAEGGILLTQNGLPFLQPDELRQSVAYFRELFADAFAYLVTTPGFFGGPMAFGWATDNAKLRHAKRGKIERRYAKAGAFPTRYWRPDVHVAAFALPTYVRELVEG
jgi:spermidine synthase